MGPRARKSAAPEWLTVAEAAVELGLSTRQAYRWVDKRWLPAYRYRHVPRGGHRPVVHLRVKRADVDRILAEAALLRAEGEVVVEGMTA